MIISHNLMAMNTKRQLGINEKSKIKSAEKLSSGYKINRSSDDSSGLAISEKMRRQIRGLQQASANSQDGISLIQIADGAMAEIHDMLHRGTELSVKAANEILSDDERIYIQEELDQIKKEIDSISVKTLFNEIPVLLGERIYIPGKSGTPVVNYKGGLPSWVGLGPSGVSKYMADSYQTNKTLEITDNFGNVTTQSVVVNHSAAILDFTQFDASNPTMYNDLIGNGFYTTCCTCTNHYSIEFVDQVTNSYEQSGTHHIYKVGIQNVQNTADLLNRIVDATNNGRPNNHYTQIVADTANNRLIVYDGRSSDVSANNVFFDNNITIPSGGSYQWTDWSGILYAFNTKASSNSGMFGPGVARADRVGWTPDSYLGISSLNIQVGAEAGQQIRIDLPNASCKSIGINNVDVTTQTGARDSIDAFHKAVRIINGERSLMGAYQNRLTHTINNLDNIVENVQAAESIIRDTDMAREMVRFSNHNILTQVGQSMLAQANQTSQGVMSLLR